MTFETAKQIVRATDDMNGVEIALATLLRDQQQQINDLKRHLALIQREVNR